MELEMQDKEWAKARFDLLRKKMRAECERIGSAIPYVVRDGVYDDKSSPGDIHWWTNGFWPGMLWQMYKLTGDGMYSAAARGVEEKLDAAFAEFVRLHHDVGFMWLPSAVADYRLTGSERSRDRGLHAATILAGRYNPAGKYIRAWNKGKTGWVIIDSLMNIPLLYWASREVEDPRFDFIARSHADTVMEKLVRPDGSCGHIAVLDPRDGSLLETPAGQGYAPGSSWSRGQAWAIYGFALSYHHTGDERYLDCAKRVAHYFCSQVAQTEDVPLVDFRAPGSPIFLDTSAGSCAACGLLEISEHVSGMEKDFYRSWAMRLMRSLDSRYCNWDPQTDGLLEMSTVAYDDESCRHKPLIFGDYFYLEALLRLGESSVLIW